MNKTLLLITSLLQLTKPVISLSVAFSALMGFLLARGSFSEGWFALYAGVLLIAAGSSAINQVQEVRFDKLMKRTRNRPLPKGNLSYSRAVIWAGILSVSGALILWILTSPVSSFLAILTLLWYNVVYTPLKRITAYAVIPGALVGALPPAIGWSAAGGIIWHPNIILVCTFFFIGQIPHFWLILLKHSEDYRRAGFPAITSLFSISQINRLTMVWITATALAAVALPVSGVIYSDWFSGLVYIFSAVLISFFIPLITGAKPVKARKTFILLNIYYLLIMLVIMADSLSR